MIYYYSRITKKEIVAGAFALCLAVFLIVMVFISINAAGPFVVGTELNPNGTTEYLCMGRGCEGLTPMDY